MQDFRSSTIEPFYEWMPSFIRDINPRESVVFLVGNIPFQDQTRSETRFRLFCNELSDDIMRHFYEDELVVMRITNVLQAIADQPDVFVITSRRVAYSTVYLQTNTTELGLDINYFPWKLSARSSGSIFDVIFMNKFVPWRETLNRYLLTCIEQDLLRIAEPVETKKLFLTNPHKNRDYEAVNLLHIQSLMIFFIIAAIFTAIIFILEIAALKWKDKQSKRKQKVGRLTKGRKRMEVIMSICATGLGFLLLVMVLLLYQSPDNEKKQLLFCKKLLMRNHLIN